MCEKKEARPRFPFPFPSPLVNQASVLGTMARPAMQTGWHLPTKYKEGFGHLFLPSLAVSGGHDSTASI
jgi:hypothetical protein